MTAVAGFFIGVIWTIAVLLIAARLAQHTSAVRQDQFHSEKEWE